MEFSSIVEKTDLTPDNNVICEGEYVNYCKGQPMIANLRITPSGRFMFVAYVHGGLDYWQVTMNGKHAVRKGTLLNMTVNIGTYNELGMDMTMSHDFNEATGGYLFLSVVTKATDYKTTENFVAEIWRITVTENDKNELVESERRRIYNVAEKGIAANAHNLHGGITVALPDARALIVSFGDLNNPSTSVDTSVDFGKLLIMDYNGSQFEREVFDTRCEDNRHLAIGNRNLYNLDRFSMEEDIRERFVWGENGDSYERAVVIDLLSPQIDECIHLGWGLGGETAAPWKRLQDPLTKNNAVTYFGIDQGGVYTKIYSVPERYQVPGTSYVLRSYMAQDRAQNTQGDMRLKTLNLEVISNLNNAPQPSGSHVVAQLAWTRTASPSAPMAVDVHFNDTIFMSDVFTSKIYALRITNWSMLSDGVFFPACAIAHPWYHFFAITPSWYWGITSILLTVFFLFWLLLCLYVSLCVKYRRLRSQNSKQRTHVSPVILTQHEPAPRKSYVKSHASRRSAVFGNIIK
jgi:hypothetical protein